MGTAWTIRLLLDFWRFHTLSSDFDLQSRLHPSSKPSALRFTERSEMRHNPRTNLLYPAKSEVTDELFSTCFDSRVKNSSLSACPFSPVNQIAPALNMANESLKTPPKCTADFCLIPIGTPTASVSAQIADVQRLMKRSGLSYSMHSAGTTVVSALPLPLFIASRQSCSCPFSPPSC